MEVGQEGHLFKKSAQVRSSLMVPWPREQAEEAERRERIGSWWKGHSPAGLPLSSVTVNVGQTQGGIISTVIDTSWLVEGVGEPGGQQAHAVSAAEIASLVQATYKSPGCNYKAS